MINSQKKILLILNFREIYSPNFVDAAAVGYTVDTLQYGWLKESVDIDESVEIAQFTLVDYKQHDCSQNYTAGSSVYYWAKRRKTNTVKLLIHM